MTALRLHDSLRRQKVSFEPLVKGQVGMYVCGPTTYTPSHIGHAYSAIAFDTIRRSLMFLGYEVRYVRNITDVDDKIINRAHRDGEEPMAMAARFADDYNRDMARFGVMAPTVEPKVSGHISEIIAVINRLIETGNAYPSHGDVYFEVATFPAYGQLSGQSPDELRAGERVAVDERKRAPADFALWKAAKPGEPQWDSPWGPGRPGWHIECSAMIASHLGDTFDIHGGGKDLIFPHHENEIAQSQGAYGEGSFARYWLHNGFLNFAGEKMERSKGNVFNADQIADLIGGEGVRFFFVSHHYRSPIELDIVRTGDGPRDIQFASFEAADRRLAYFYETLQRIDDLIATGGDGGSGAVHPGAEMLIPAATDALADDFNAPVAVAALGDAAKLANKLLDEAKGVDKQLRRRSLARLARDLRAVGEALGVLNTPPATYLAERTQRLVARKGIEVARVEQLIADRVAARRDKQFEAADAIRKTLTDLGIEVFDSPDGARWRVRDDEPVAAV